MPMRFVVAALLSVGTPVWAQVMNFGDTGVLAGAGAFVERSFTLPATPAVTGLSIVGDMLQAGGTSFQSDMQVSISGPGVFFIRGPGSGGWSPGGAGQFPPSSGAPGTLDAHWPISLPSAAGVWTVRFENAWNQAGPMDSLRWDHLVLTLEAPLSGACCYANTHCTIMSGADCTNSGGVYRGDGTGCGQPCPPGPDAWVERGDAGELPATAQSTVQSDPGTPFLRYIAGTLGSPGSADVYRIRVYDYTIFEATTMGGTTTIDTQLFVFRENGAGAVGNDDSPFGGVQSFVNRGALCPPPSPGVNANGVYYLAVSAPDYDPVSGAGLIFPDIPANAVVCATGPGASLPLGGWTGASAATGTYIIDMLGVSFAQPPGVCYANCDASTTAPILNVADFTCFLQRFAAADPYANCDQSTTPPVLNVADFTCFLQSFAAGCP